MPDDQEKKRGVRLVDVFLSEPELPLNNSKGFILAAIIPPVRDLVQGVGWSRVEAPVSVAVTVPMYITFPLYLYLLDSTSSNTIHKCSTYLYVIVVIDLYSYNYRTSRYMKRNKLFFSAYHYHELFDIH